MGRSGRGKTRCRLGGGAPRDTRWQGPGSANSERARRATHARVPRGGTPAPVARRLRPTVCSRPTASAPVAAGQGRRTVTHSRGVATKAFWIALIVGFLVQAFKGFSQYFRTGHWNLRRFVETGGMPSSHAASVAALSTSVAIQEGFRSPLFGVTLYFSLVVMYDAAGLRRAAGRQAAILNRLIEEHLQHPERETQRLMELLGHTPFEVFIGAALGVLSALLWHMYS